MNKEERLSMGIKVIQPLCVFFTFMLTGFYKKIKKYQDKIKEDLLWWNT